MSAINGNNGQAYDPGHTQGSGSRVDTSLEDASFAITVDPQQPVTLQTTDTWGQGEMPGAYPENQITIPQDVGEDPAWIDTYGKHYQAELALRKNVNLEAEGIRGGAEGRAKRLRRLEAGLHHGSGSAGCRR